MSNTATYTKKKRCPVSIHLEPDVLDEVARIAKEQHRSISSQIAFFCAKSVARQKEKEE